MSYKTLRELPKGVQGDLPRHAQDIYREAFNSAFEEYRDPANAVAILILKRLPIE